MGAVARMPPAKTPVCAQSAAPCRPEARLGPQREESERSGDRDLAGSLLLAAVAPPVTRNRHRRARDQNESTDSSPALAPGDI
jgi:hypothetical protein